MPFLQLFTQVIFATAYAKNDQKKDYIENYYSSSCRQVQ
jgi:hypothetical protein